jgi:hypothetical protein
LCKSTPRRIFDTVIPAMMMSAPTQNPSAHASNMSPCGAEGFTMSSEAISPWHSEEEDVDVTSDAEVAFRKVMDSGIPGACKNDRALFL